MRQDERELLEALNGELEFWEKGGYARAAGTSWRPVFIFEDSPICVNHDYEVNPASCSNCVLMRLVPPEFRSAKFPCRHIPLNAARETLDSLYRYGDEHEVKEAITKWLQATVRALEEQRRKEAHPHSEEVRLSGSGAKGTALYEKAKCANPACPVSFDWRGSGKFFRFREPPNQAAVDKPPAGVHGVRHFWLCGHCSNIFTLSCEEPGGVVLRLRPDLIDTNAEGAPAAAGS